MPRSRWGLAVATVTSGMGRLSSPATIMVTDCVCASARFAHEAMANTANIPMVTLTNSCFSKSIVRLKFIFKLWEFIAEVDDDLPISFAVNTEIQPDIGGGQRIAKPNPRIRKIDAGKQTGCIIGLYSRQWDGIGHIILHILVGIDAVEAVHQFVPYGFVKK